MHWIKWIAIKHEVMIVLQNNFLKSFGLKSEVHLFLLSKKVFLTELSTSQKKLSLSSLENKIEIRLIKNWRSIFLLTTGVKLISKALAKRIKKLLSSLISPNRTAYLENWFISERGRLVSDILEETNNLKSKDFLH